MTYSGSGRISTARSNCACAAERSPAATASRPRPAIEGACCGTSRRAASYASRAASGWPSCCWSWPTRASANAVFSGARPGDAAARCIASSAPGRSPCSSRTYDRRARLVRSADCSTRRSTASDASSYRPSSIRASTTTARAPDDDGSSAVADSPISSASANSCLPSRMPPSPTSGSASSGRSRRAACERGFGGRVERRVGRLADPLQQREAELELRLTVVGVLGDASGEELDEALGGWRRRRRCRRRVSRGRGRPDGGGRRRRAPGAARLGRPWRVPRHRTPRGTTRP